MTRKTNRTPPVNPTEFLGETVPNAQRLAFYSFDPNTGQHSPGLTKTEWATIQFIAAHIKAHGTNPSHLTIQNFVELATLCFNGWIAPPAAGEFDNKEEELP